MKRVAFALFLLVALVSCKQQPSSSVFNNTPAASEIDLAQLEDAGEIIAATLYGPESYFEYRGQGAGLGYLMAEKFANDHGLRLRVEVAKDTAELLSLLKEMKADVIAVEIDEQLIKRNNLRICGPQSQSGSWAVRETSPQLEEELNAWYSTQIRQQVLAQSQQQTQRKYKVRRNNSVFYSKQKGIVSGYDVLFQRAGQICGWPWQLLAAQCYQESGFDPQATSWAGARGLMQIMPSTAKTFGVDPASLYDAQTNVLTASRCIKQLESRFSAIRDPGERKKFVLAAYNGGSGHIADAQALARKYGRNPNLWNDVSYYVLHLSEPKYYRDPVVKHGFMIGSETYNYVNSVMELWGGYQQVLHNTPARALSKDETELYERKTNRFSEKQTIMTNQDSLFKIKR